MMSDAMMRDYVMDMVATVVMVGVALVAVVVLLRVTVDLTRAVAVRIRRGRMRRAFKVLTGPPPPKHVNCRCGVVDGPLKPVTLSGIRRPMNVKYTAFNPVTLRGTRWRGRLDDRVGMLLSGALARDINERIMAGQGGYVMPLGISEALYRRAREEGVMYEVTQEAMDGLDASIVVWKGKMKDPANASYSSGDCPLCVLYSSRRVAGVCKNECPIKMDSGAGCEGTPFGEAKEEKTHATVGAMLDYLVALKVKCEVKAKALTLADLEPGEKFKWEHHGPGVRVVFRPKNGVGECIPPRRGTRLVFDPATGGLYYGTLREPVVRCDLQGEEVDPCKK